MQQKQKGRYRTERNQQPERHPDNVLRCNNSNRATAGQDREHPEQQLFNHRAAPIRSDAMLTDPPVERCTTLSPKAGPARTGR